MKIEETMEKYLVESKLKNYGYWDDPLGAIGDTDELITVLGELENSHSNWNFKDAEVHAKRALKLMKSLSKEIKIEMKGWYKMEKEREKEKRSTRPYPLGT